MSESLVHIVTIEGIANTTDQLKICYPKVPTSHSGDANYIAGLAERPSGVTGQWDFVKQTLSVGRFSLRFLEGKLPFEWMATKPPVRAQIAETLTSSDTTVDIDRPAATAGWSSLPTVVYCDRETWKVTSSSGTPDITVTRGYGGSDAATHAIGADVYDRPPVLVGREVTVYETPAIGGTETVVLRGFVSGEPAMGALYPHISVTTTWTKKMIQRSPAAVPIGTLETLLPVFQSGDQVDYRPHGITTDRSLWMLPNGGVVTANYDSSADSYTFLPPEVGLVWGQYEYEAYDTQAAESGFVTQVLFSDATDAPYTAPPFGRDTLAGYPASPAGSPVASDNPFIIVLNLLLTTKDADNYDNGDDYTYDLGDSSSYNMWPWYGLGIPRAQVDLATFETAVDVYEGIRCDRLWLGAKEEALWDVIGRILRPLGYACGADRTGTITLVRLSDVYPGDTTITLSRNRNILPGSVQHQTMSRTVNTITVELSPGPEGDSTATYEVTETGARELYPEQIGSDVTVREAPYSYQQFVGDENRMALIYATLVRRLAASLPVVSVKLNATGFNDIDLGTPVTIYDRSIRDPATGLKMTDSSTALKGLVTSVSPDFENRTQSVEVALVSTGNVCLINKAAEVTGGSSATFNVAGATYGGSPTDPQTFSAGDKVVLLDEHLVARSGTVMTVQSVTSSTIVVDANGDGFTAGDIIVDAEWDDCVTSQQESGYAWDADGGAPTTSYPSLGSGSDDPFIYGD